MKKSKKSRSKNFDINSVKPLSNIDIIEKLKKHDVNINFIPYKDLKHLNNLDQIIPCILLYQLHYPVGHWVAIFENKEGINYFDPLGYVPDKLLKTSFQHPEGREVMNADFTYLNQLLLEYLEDHDLNNIVYNEVKLQPSGTNTCGYWTSARLMFKDLTNDEFNSYFKEFKVEDRERKVVKYFNKL
jgi:hypothetical protein